VLDERVAKAEVPDIGIRRKVFTLLGPNCIKVLKKEFLF